MIRTVAVVSNISKPFKPASLPISMGLRQGFWVKWLFYCLRAAVPLTIAKHLHGWRGRKHRAAHHPVDNPTELYARYRARHGDMVRQDPYRMNRIPMGKLVHTHGLGGELLTLGETMSKRNYMRNALELALEALEESKEHIAKHLRLEAIHAIKEALDQIEPVQVSPLDFVEMVYEKEHLVGRPMIWAEWPVRDKNYRKGETD